MITKTKFNNATSNELQDIEFVQKQSELWIDDVNCSDRAKWDQRFRMLELEIQHSEALKELDPIENKVLPYIDEDKDELKTLIYSRAKQGISEKIIADFILTPVAKLESEEGIQMEAMMKTKLYKGTVRSKTVIINSVEAGDVGAFRKAHCDVDFNFLGRSEELMTFNSQVLKVANVPVKYLVSETGIQTVQNVGKVMVFGNKIINSNGDEIDNVRYKNSYPATKFNLNQNDFLSEEEKSEISKYILSFNDKSVTYNLIGWLSATFFKNDIQTIYNGFPILYCVGETGAAKTTSIQNIIGLLYGMATKDLTDFYGCSDFIRKSMVSESKSIPVIFDEIKPHKNPIKMQDWCNLVNGVYNANAAKKGKQINGGWGLNTYKQCGPMVGLGETTIGDKSVMDRCVVVDFARHKSAPHKSEFDSLINLPIQKIGSELMMMSLNTSESELIEIYKEIDEIAQKGYVDRQRHNKTIICLGLVIVCRILNLNLSIEEMTKEIFKVESSEHYDSDELFDETNAADKVVRKLIDFTTTMKSLDQREEEYVNKGYALINNVHYRKDEDGFFYFHIRTCWPTVKKWAKDHDENLIFDKSIDFIKQIQERPCFVANGVSKKLNGTNESCLKVKSRV